VLRAELAHATSSRPLATNLEETDDRTDDVEQPLADPRRPGGFGDTPTRNRGRGEKSEDAGHRAGGHESHEAMKPEIQSELVVAR
jgi:hypothetical protein